jgi:hypothetical protein
MRLSFVLSLTLLVLMVQGCEQRDFTQICATYTNATACKVNTHCTWTDNACKAK